MAYKYSTGSVDRGDIYYEDDAGKNTYLDWAEDQLDIVVGAKSMIKMVEAATDKITLNNGGSNVDLQIKSNNNANLIRTDGGNDRVGIGTSAPASTFEVSGSQAGNFLDFADAANLTLDETHYMVVFSNATDGEKCYLPKADTCPGRVYHIFNQTGGEEGGVIGLYPDDTAPDTIEHQDALELNSSTGNTSVSIVSDGDTNWLVFGQYSPS